MLISELAERTGVSTRALRHYDRQGLLPSRRQSNRYRDFPEEAVERVRRIRLLLEVGIDLAAVARLMPCFDGDGQLTTCGVVRERLTTEIRRLDDGMARMRETRALLVSALDNAVSGPARG